MWIFTPKQFLSVVAYNPDKDVPKTIKRKGKTYTYGQESIHRAIALASEDPKGTWLLVRARVGADLETMQKDLGIDLHIYEDVYSDYSWRALITRDEYKRFLAMQVDAIDYGAHFKEVVEKRSDRKTSAQRYSAMMKVWSAMAALQSTVPYTGQKRPEPVSSKWPLFSGSSAKDSASTWLGGSGPTSSARDAEFAAWVEDDWTDGKIGFTELGEILAVRPAKELTEAEIENLDMDCLDVYLAILEDQLGDSTFELEEFAAYVERQGFSALTLHDLLPDDDEDDDEDPNEWVEASDIADVAIGALEKTGWFDSVTELEADENSSSTKLVLDGAEVIVTIDMYLPSEATPAAEILEI